MLGFTNASVSTARYNNPLRQVATPLTGDSRAFRNAQTRTNDNRLRPSIDAAMERSARDFDDNEKMAAKKASLESMSIMGSLDFGDLPFVEFSDSGILTLQWAREGRGVLLSFSGDGVFGFSIKRSPKDSYSETYREREVKDGVDPDTRSEISWISNIGSDAEAA